MAAIDLHHGLEHGGCGWGTERAELLDSFDSEMQEWEDQLQDMQKQIEELYNEVQARRGGNDGAVDNGKSTRGMNFGSRQHEKVFSNLPGRYSKNDHHLAADLPNGSSCNYAVECQNSPVIHRNGSYSFPHENGVANIGNLLQDYLGHGMIQKNQNANNAVLPCLNQLDKVSQDMFRYQDKIKNMPGNEKMGKETFLDGFEEAQNRKTVKSTTFKDLKIENADAKPPLRQRDAPLVPPRSTSQLPSALPDSPALEKKQYNPGGLVDRKSSSPSILRKFGAMLQENEGKTLMEGGVLSNLAAPETMCLTPGCRRRTLSVGRAPTRVPAQKCEANSNVMTAEMDRVQEWGGVTDSGRQSQMAEHRGTSMGGYSHPKGPQAGPEQSQRRMAGSPKPRPRAHFGTEKDYGQRERAQRPVLQAGENREDNWTMGCSTEAHKVQRGELPCCGGFDGLGELLDMLEIEHPYSLNSKASNKLCRQDAQQVSRAELSPATPRRTFSRPARPANQRPPSRWASINLPPGGQARISVPVGPMSRPPSPLPRPQSSLTHSASPLARPRSPLTIPSSPLARPHSPAMNLGSYLLHTETVIM